MWILLMIVFSQPYQISHIDVMGAYGSKKSCSEEVQRALSLDIPVKASFGCILVKGLPKLQGVTIRS